MIRLVPVLFVVALLSACGGGPDVSALSADRVGWDTLRVDLGFESGRGRSVRPDSIRFLLFDAEYDTVFVGADTTFAIPDATLGNEETLLLEACGWFDGRVACDQIGLSSSPKRLVSPFEPEYPFENALDRLRLETRTRVERQTFESEDWEELSELGAPPLSLQLRVLDSEDRGMTVPIRPGRRVVPLDKGEAYRDFRFHLRSRMRDTGAARVRFELLADLGSGPEAQSAVERSIAFKTEQEQIAELGFLVEAVGGQIVELMADQDDLRQSYVFVNEWNYLMGSATYRAEIEVHWRESRRRRWHELVLSFAAADSAKAATVRLSDANERGWARWRSRADADTLRVAWSGEFVPGNRGVGRGRAVDELEPDR